MRQEHNTGRESTYPKVRPKLDNIPETLKAQHWAVWVAEPRIGQPGKFNKAPRNPRTGSKVGANKPELFGTYDEARDAYESGSYSGIGVLLTGDDVTGFDIDYYEKVFAENPAVKAWVTEARHAGGYCERSPSGDGLRLFVRGKLPAGGRRCGSLEIYDDARFLTVTGNVPSGHVPAAELIDGQHLIDKFLAFLPAQEAAAKPDRQAINAEQAASADIAAIAEWASEKRPSLWSGNWEQSETDLGATGYPSQSEADMALCGQIAREAVRRGVSADCLQDLTMCVFEQSGLYRAEKHRTIENYAVPKAAAAALASEVSLVEVAQEGLSEPTARVSAATEFATVEPGDIMAATVFAKEYAGRLRYVPQAGRWLNWNGVRWVWCATGEEMLAAKTMANTTLRWAVKLCQQDADRNKKRLAFAMRLQNLPRLLAMLELAKSEPGMSIGHISDLDADAWLLGVRNGVLNLRNGALLTPDPAMLITRQAAAEYQREAQCPRWLAFLDQVFMGDTETVEFIQRALGYTLTATTTEEVLFICFGHGANGKSVFGNVVSSIMADYAQAAPASLLTARRADDTGPRNDIARLCGARLTSINETQNGDRLDEQVVKMLAGREMLSARYLNKEFFDFWPTAKPWLRTNHRPVVTGEDDGIWRRLLLIPFARKFADHERNPWLEQQLLEERDGILAWMVAGCLEWQRLKGLKPSATVRRESAGYRTESDLLGEFLGDITIADPNARIEQSDLFGSWRNWCDASGVRHGSKANFSRKLHERQITQAASNGKRFYTGVKRRQPEALS